MRCSTRRCPNRRRFFSTTPSLSRPPLAHDRRRLRLEPLEDRRLLATLTVTLPLSATEGDSLPTGAGSVTVDQAPTGDVVVELTSDDTTEVAVPATVTILTGQTSATFDVTVIDDTEIDDMQVATITAHVDGWTDGSAMIDVVDDEDYDLVLALPADAWEGDGSLARAEIGMDSSGFTVRDVKSTGDVDNLAAADALLADALLDPVGPLVSSQEVLTNVDVIDYGTGGHYNVNNDWPRSSGELDEFIINARGTLVVNQGGTYTFGVHTDDGSRLRIDVNDDGFDDADNVIEDDMQHPGWDRFGQVVLPAGTYALDYTFFEHGADEVAELFVAEGCHNAWNSNFELLTFATTLLRPSVSISGTLPSDLVVTLASDDASEVDVPSTVTILAGTTSATFESAVVDDADYDGVQTATVTASAVGFTDANDTMSVRDDEVDHFAFAAIASPQTASDPFAATIYAKNIDNETILPYATAVDLSGTGVGGAVTVEPATTGAFVAGAWRGSMTVHAADTGVVLTADNGSGHTGTSSAFDVSSGSRIIDDGDAGFGTSGDWYPYSDLGFGGDLHYSFTGDGSDVASWTFSVTPGQYQVAATWSEHPNRATNAPYTVFNGATSLGTVPVNQQATPDDFTDQGTTWESLGTYTITGDTLLVELSDAANGLLIADAVRIEKVVPRIIDDGDTGFSTTGGWYPYSDLGFGDDLHYSFVGDGSDVASWTFTVTPGQYEVAATWSEHPNRATNAPYEVFDGATSLGTVPVNQQAAPDDFSSPGATWETLGIYAITGDTLLVELSDSANGLLIADAVRIERVGDLPPTQIIDNGDPNFGTSGDWYPYSGLGFESDLHYSFAGDGSDVASWTFSVTPGQYEVAATWSEQPNRATNAPYSIYDGAELEATVPVNQQNAPDDFTYESHAWKSLGTYTITTGTLVVELSDDIAVDQLVTADAIYARPVPQPFPGTAATDPAGSLVYTSSISATIGLSNETDTFAIELDDGQRVTVVVDPDATLQPTIELSDPLDTSLGTATAAAAGEDAVLQTVATTGAGTYTVTIGGVASTTGGYTVRLILNAAAENESHGGPTNDDAASAEDLDGSFLALDGGAAERGAVLGTSGATDDWYQFTLDDGQLATLGLTELAGNLTLELYDGTAALLAIGMPAGNLSQVINNFVDTTSNGTADTYYAVVSGTPGIDYSLVLTCDADFDTEPNGDTGTAQAITPGGVVLGYAEEITEYAFTKIADTTGPLTDIGATPTINNSGTVAFGASSETSPDGAIYVGNGGPLTEIVNTNGQFSNLSFIGILAGDIDINDFGEVAFFGELTAGGSGIFVYSGGSITTIAETGGTYASFQPYGTSINNAGAVGFAADLQGGGDGVFTGDGTTVTTIADTTGPFSSIPYSPIINELGRVVFIASLDAGGSGIFTSDGGPVTTIADTTGPLQSFTAGNYINDSGLVAFRATMDSGEEGVFTGNGGALTTIADTTGPFSVLRDLAANNEGVVAIYAYLDAGGTGVFTGSDPVADKVIASGDPLDGSTVSSVQFHGYGINDNGQVAFTATLADGRKGVFIATPKSPSDYYAVNVTAGDPLTLTTATPADGSSEFVNDLDPMLELYDPAGTLVASDDNSGPDGRNAQLSHTAAETGVYTVRVLAAGESQGEYILRVTGHTGTAAFEVAATDPADGSLVGLVPQLTVDFDDLVLPGTLDASDLTVGGTPAVGVTLIDGNTAVFDLPALTEGVHNVVIAAGAILDVQSTPIEAYAGQFTIDQTAPSVPVDTDGAANEVAEGALPGTNVGLTAFSTDTPPSAITYSLADDAGGRFQIDPGTGVVSVANGALLDYETAASHQITVQAEDAAINTSTETFTINVTNAAPTADAGGPYATGEGTTVVLDGSASSDPGGGIAFYEWDLDDDGQYDDAAGAAAAFSSIAEGTFTVGLRVTDGGGAWDTGTATVTVNNVAPTANPDGGAAFTTDKDTPLTTGNVLANDTDPGLDTLTIQSFDTTGTLGLVTNNGDGTFGYDPNGRFELLSDGEQATDTFQYTLSDGDGGFDTATVTITVFSVTTPVCISSIDLVSIIDPLLMGNMGNNDSYEPSISSDGRYVAFWSEANNLVAGDNNGYTDIFVRDTQTGVTTRVSTDSSGNEGNRGSLNPSISSGGRYVAFRSVASNLVTDDTNGENDIFVKDTQTGVTTRVSTDSSGNEAEYDSYDPSISSNGRYVAFYSRASNLVPGDTNGRDDIFVKDTQTGVTTRVSTDSSGNEGDGGSYDPSISSDGRYVAFQSLATNLVTGDTNDEWDVFVKDTQTGVTTRVSTDSSGNEAEYGSYDPALSSDGRYVAFWSGARNLVPGDTNSREDVFVKDTQTGVTTRVSTDSSGNEGNAGSAGRPSISSDGRYVAFKSVASNLVPEDTNGVLDVFVKDTQTGVTTRVSTDSSGIEGNEESRYPSISSDGRRVAFQSEASNLVTGDTNEHSDVFVHDTQTGVTETASDTEILYLTGNAGSYDPSISSNGRYIAFRSDASNLVTGDTNGAWDIFVRDTQMGVTTRVSTDSTGTQGNYHSYDPSISSDGRYVAFSSEASNLVMGDTSWPADVFVKDTQTGVTTRVSTDSSGNEADSSSGSPSISADGRYVAFMSWARNLVPGDTNADPDVFVKDTQTGVTTRMSTDSSGNEADGYSDSPSISADGRYVAFRSFASNLVTGGTSGWEIFVKDTQTGTTTLVSANSDGIEGSGYSYDPSISADGRYVAFSSDAYNLVTGDHNCDRDVFVKDTQTGVTARVSTDSSGNGGNGDSLYPSISSDGRYVAFWSDATNLVPGDTNGCADVFVKDMQTGATTRVSADSSGNEADGYSDSPSISADGRYVAFHSFASNLHPDDPTMMADVFSRFLIRVNVTAISGPTTEAGGTATFNVTLASPPTDDVTVPLSSSDLTEGTVVPASVTITPAQWQTGVLVTVTGVDDVVIDGNTAYTIVTGDPTSADGNYDALGAGDVGDVAVTNNDDEVPIEISGRKFEDLDADGTDDGGTDPGLDGTTIELWLDGGNTAADFGTGDDTPVTTTVTGVGGLYSFPGLGEGAYYVREAVPWGFAQTTQQAYHTIIAQSGVDVPDRDFGNAALGSIHGFKFTDVDADGIYTPSVDRPLTGVEFTLTGTDGRGNVIDRADTTGDNGYFEFTGLLPSVAGAGFGTGYTVTETVPPGFMATTPTSFTRDLLSRQELAAFAGQSGAALPQVEVLIGAPLMFGNTVPSSIHGFKYEDLDADGVYTPGADWPLPGVEFTLTGTDGRGNAVNATDTTDASGYFEFTGLLPSVAGAGFGTGYTVTETVPPGYAATTPTVFSSDLLSGQELVAESSQAMIPPMELEVQKLLASTGGGFDFFGMFVAIDGNVAVVAAPLANLQGAAYIYEFQAGSWTEVAKLMAAADHFRSVDISGDTVVIGGESYDGVIYVGSAYIYERPATGWATTSSFAAKLTAADGADDDHFGCSVGISGDTVVIGAYGDDDNGSRSGSAYVYERPGGGWATTSSFDAKLTASDGAAEDFFGLSVGISGDTVVIGAPDDDDNGDDSGSAYVYERPATGWATTSNFDAKLTASDGAADEHFGCSVALSGDTVVIGAKLNDDNGSAYVYQRPAGGWATTSSFDAKLTAADGAADDHFGGSVGISGDTVVIGASGDDDNGSRSGSAYVYQRPGTGWTTTSSFDAKLIAGDGAADDTFGRSVGISGSTIVVGAPDDDDNGSAAGSAYMFSLAVDPRAEAVVGTPLMFGNQPFYDFGDAPDPGYPTLRAADGARHLCVGPTLGADRDDDPDGQPSDDADGDDADGNDDEDGVVFGIGLVQGETTAVTITASAPGLLDAWIDFDRSGDWDAGEQVFTNEPLAAGANHLGVAVPADASPGDTFARFRFSTAGNLAPTGPADDGEVEDYQVTVFASAPPIQIIDDGDTGFGTIGDWSPYAFSGFEGDLHYSFAGDGSDTASWSFTVSPGQYRVAATWTVHKNRATNAPYEVFNGATSLGTVPVNQEVAPDDFTDQGAMWETLGAFTVTGDTLVVELSDIADGLVIADAVRIERVPVQIVDDGDVGFGTSGAWYPYSGLGFDDDLHYSFVGDGSDVASWTFIVTPGQYEVAATWTAHTNRATNAPYEVFNGATSLGTAPVNQRAAPDDFSDQGTAWETIGTYTIMGDTLLVELSDAANGLLIADAVRIEWVGDVPTAQIIDNGGMGFGTSGDWYPYSGLGLENDLHYSFVGDGSDTASWTFTVTPGQYQVAATWSAHTNRATNAPYEVYNGTTSLETVPVNQQAAPDDFTDQGTTWETLGTYTITGDTLRVELSDAANGLLIADAVRIEQVGSPLLAAGGEVSFGGELAALTGADLQPIVTDAIADWAGAGLAADQLEALLAVDFIITDLPGAMLGLATLDAIYLDVNAAGHGWFIDPTPGVNEEFQLTGSELRAVDPRAVDRMDLLTVVSHELGHTLGLEDLSSSSESLMSGTLETGLRREPGVAEIDALFTQF